MTDDKKSKLTLWEKIQYYGLLILIFSVVAVMIYFTCFGGR